MGNILEQAIVDAKTLRAAATKNAEEVLKERYSDKIKEAVERLLEQDDEEEISDELPMDDMDIGLEDEVKPKGDTEKEAGYATLTGDEEEIEISFDELEKAIEAEEDEEESEEMIDREEATKEIEDEIGDETSDEEELDVGEEDLMEAISDALEEELKVDVEVVPSGYSTTTELEREENQEIILARLEDDEVKEENEELKKSISQLNEQKTKQRKNIHFLKEENKKYKNILLDFKDKIEKVNLINAKLLYQNKILGTVSLNERQKENIVEAISKVSSVEEAKVVYETLKNSMKTSSRKVPNSLKEAIERPSSAMFSRQEKTESTNPARERMRFLAGIKNK